jgi:hypothetical protein
MPFKRKITQPEPPKRSSRPVTLGKRKPARDSAVPEKRRRAVARQP